MKKRLMFLHLVKERSMNMKSNFIFGNTILVGILLFLFSACSDDAFISKGTVNIKEGVAVNLSLSYSTTQQKVQSRVVQNTATEYNVSSIYLFVFNQDGTIDAKGNATFSGGKYSEGSGTAEGVVNDFQVHSGKGKKIYAIANADASAGDMSTSRLEEVKNEDELRDLQVTLNNPLNIDRLAFLMAGTIVDDAGNNVQVVDIDENGNIYASGSAELLNKNLLLRRVDARVTFKIKVDITKDTEAEEGTITNATFIPRSFEVHNLPSSSHIYAVPEQITTTYASMDENTSLPFDSEERDDMWFNFYMFENHQDVSSDSKEYITSDKKQQINPNAENLYALREQKNIGGSFIFAPKNATYVIFKGDLSYQRTSNGVAQWVNAAVEYTVHLGETGDDADSPDLVNNYTVNRNTFYTYNVTIQGLESIRVEVLEEKEQRPGYEGDVIVAGAQVKNIDSHFGRSLIKLTKKDILGGLSWVIQTKYDQGVKVAGSEINTLKDYKWILFAINKEFGISRGAMINGSRVDLVKFPGYGAYDGGANTINNVPGDATLDVGNKNDWKQQLKSGHGEYANAYYKDYVSDLDDDACLRDINQLINHLSIEAKSNSDIFEEEDEEEVVYITAFIDEYIYTYNPQKEEFRFPGSITSSDTDRLKLWKDVVNGEDRLMHVCTGEAKYSPDGNSSWSNSVVTFKQSPIYSIYNEDDPDLATAWGTESIIETGALPLSSTHGPTGTLSNTDNNGRLNTLNFFVYGNSSSYTRNGTKWGEVLERTNSSLTTEEELKDGYRDIWHACMIRNRDLNGNNVIDPEEVRWFLASIDELTDLWIGEATMPSEAKLYSPNPNDPSAVAGTYCLHVASSSYNRNTNSSGGTNTYTNPSVIWAEEGASKGASFESKGFNVTKENYTYRCVRYLGISLDDIRETPEDYVVATKQSNGNYILSMSKLGRLAKRTAYDQGMELPDHKEREANNNNKPYEKFEVIMSPTGEANTGRYWNDETYRGNTITQGFESMLNYSGPSKLCPKGYRVPNQRELMLMYTSISDWGGGNYWCATKFSFNGNGKFSDRPGFAYNSPNMVLINLNEAQGSGSNVKNKVRCVRDLTN